MMPEKKKQQIAKKGSMKAQKPIAKDDKKRRKSRKESYSIDIYKVTKQVHPDTSISSKATSTMNSFADDIFERIVGETSRLAHCNKRSTISSRETQTTCACCCPGNWPITPCRRGSKAVTTYTSSKQNYIT
ncbi:hypothetical protein scyTo_0001387 [Scyliorhinus torazame]|uniref:Core Histone H2A/H2B/H3 domain-containing protein n=1 Tax=Scyliorhinus torazame TaxID=75743 RepID=A0A401PCJ4_SCYTO|nr:hypothetical protein [Scyliorhinus torazame]